MRPPMQGGNGRRHQKTRRSKKRLAEKRREATGEGIVPSSEETHIPHDEIFKQLLCMFYKEFMELFLPDIAEQLDFTHATFLMQQQFMDNIGNKVLELDLLQGVVHKQTQKGVRIQYEPQSYKDPTFAKRMFEYGYRVVDRYRDKDEMFIPIALFTGDHVGKTPDTYTMKTMGKDLFVYRYWVIVLREYDWQEMQHSDNPVAAAILVKTKYTPSEKREVRKAYLKMICRLYEKNTSRAHLGMIMGVADTYFAPTKEEDEALLRELGIEQKEVNKMEIMPAWERWGYEKGIGQGRQEGVATTVMKFLNKGFTAEEIAETIELPVEQVKKMAQG